MTGSLVLAEALDSSRSRRRWLATVVVALALLVFGGLQGVLNHEEALLPHTAYHALCLATNLTTLNLIYEWAERRQLSIGRTLVTSVALTVVVSVTTTFMLLQSVAAEQFGIGPADERATPGVCIVWGTFIGIIHFAAWAIGCVVPIATADARTRQLEATTYKLEADKLRVSAELAVLRSQLEPHFVLNSLNTVAGLVTKQPREARRLLGCLGDLLRESLREPAELQTIDEEVTWLLRYTEILESRHAGLLRFRWSVEEEARGAFLPRLLLQPLVENAVNHGVLQRDGGGEVRVSIATEKTNGDGQTVVCTIEDDGVGLPHAEPRSGAFGLRSVRRRLELKYGDHASLRLDSSSEGTRAVVRLPRQAFTSLLPREAGHVE